MLGPYKLNQIYTGDAKILAEAIPDESVDLIFTDPDYTKLEDYEWLARTATRILKPVRACLAFYGIGHKDLALEALKRGGLSYRWDLILYYSNRVKRQRVDAGWNNYTGVYWMEKERMKARRGVDLLSCPVFAREDKLPDGTFHRWGKPSKFFRFWVPRFVKRGDIVVDFFAGGGVVSRVCKELGIDSWACEIDPGVAKLARRHLARARLPLITVEPRQIMLPKIE